MIPPLAVQRPPFVLSLSFLLHLAIKAAVLLFFSIGRGRGNNDWDAKNVMTCFVDAALKVVLPRFRTRPGSFRLPPESPPLLDLCAQRRQSRIAAPKLPLQTSQATPVVVAVDIGPAEASRTGEGRSTMEDSEIVKN